MKLSFQPEATAELVEALTWYAREGEDLDLQLMLRLDEILKRIVEAPDAFPTVYGHVRRAVVKQFPLFSMSRQPTKSVCLRYSIRDVTRANGSREISRCGLALHAVRKQHLPQDAEKRQGRQEEENELEVGGSNFVR